MPEQELERQAKRRLQVIRHAREVTGNVAQTCRYYGISRQTYYTWVRRYEAFGLDGLRDRSKAPEGQSVGDAGRGGLQDRLPAFELPLRPTEDSDVR